MSTVGARKKAGVPQARGSYPPVTHMVIHSHRGVRFLSRGSDAPDGARHRGDRGNTMPSLAGHQVMTRTLMHPMAADTATNNRHFQLIVDVHLLLLSDGDLLLGRRANTGYGDGAYEPPSDRLAERETLVEAAVRVAAAQVGIDLDPARVSTAPAWPSATTPPAPASPPTPPSACSHAALAFGLRVALRLHRLAHLPPSP